LPSPFAFIASPFCVVLFFCAIISDVFLSCWAFMSAFTLSCSPLMSVFIMSCSPFRSAFSLPISLANERALRPDRHNTAISDSIIFFILNLLVKVSASAGSLPNSITEVNAGVSRTGLDLFARMCATHLCSLNRDVTHMHRDQCLCVSRKSLKVPEIVAFGFNEGDSSEQIPEKLGNYRTVLKKLMHEVGCFLDALLPSLC